MWTDHDNVLVGKFADKVNTSKIAMFDLDDTLITPNEKVRAGAPYSKWKFCKGVVEKLSKLSDSLIIIVSNQANLSKYMDQFKRKVENVVKTLREKGITAPIMVYVANGYNKYRKPHTGIFSDYIVPFLKEHGVQKIVDLVYVGDAAGRENDHSDSDRKFLMNIGLYLKSSKVIPSETPYFQEPEQFFLGKPASHFMLSGIDPQKILSSRLTKAGVKNVSELDTSLHHLKLPGDQTKQEVILMIGPPGSGKSTIARRIEKEWGYVRLNQDTVGSKAKIDKELRAELLNGESIVLDSTNSKASRRRDQINIAKEYFKERNLPVNIRAFVMNGDMSDDDQREFANHLNLVRERSTNEPRVPAIVYRLYYKDYTPPSEEEGFTQIEKISFVPKFTKSSDVLNFMQRT